MCIYTYMYVLSVTILCCTTCVGIVSIVWCLLWLVLVYDTPSSHPRISQKELKYIQTALQTENNNVVRLGFSTFSVCILCITGCL